jgi:hypothetical protein
MSLRPFIALLLLTSLVSLAGLTLSAAVQDKWHSALSAGMFALAAVIVGARINIPYWQDDAVHAGGAADRTATAALRRTTRVTAIIYAWGAMALFLMYGPAGLTWRHGWQYGLAMALISIALSSYARRLGQPGSPLATPSAIGTAVRLGAVHGLAASAAVAWLIASGKLATQKGDWAANNIFLAGGLAVVLLSAFAVRTHRKLEGP